MNTNIKAKEAVDKATLAELLNMASDGIRKHFWIDDWQVDMGVLYAAYTHGFNCWINSPMLLVHSMVAGSGKTPMTQALGNLSFNPKFAVSPSGPNIYRTISAYPDGCTFCIDEADKTQWHGAGNLLAILNASWTRGWVVIRNDKENFGSSEYETFGPKILNMKEKWPPSDLLDRMLVMRMDKKPATINKLDCNDNSYEAFAIVGRRIRKHIEANTKKLAAATPIIPDAIQNRERNKWKPLFAIAELAGGDWPARCLLAAEHHEHLKKPGDDNLVMVECVLELLADGTLTPPFTSSDAVKALQDRDDWDFEKLTPNKFGIVLNNLGQPSKPNTWHPGIHKQIRGFTDDQFEELASRYTLRRSAPSKTTKTTETPSVGVSAR